MTLRAVLIGQAVVGRVKMPVETDRVIDSCAARLVPMIRMAIYAGRLSDGTSLEAVAVARGALQERLAVARRMKMAAEVHVMGGSGRHARRALTRAYRIVRIPAARYHQGEKDGYDNGAKRFLVHNSLSCAQHA